MKSSVDSSLWQRHNCLLKTVSDLLDSRLRIFLYHNEDYSVIRSGCLPLPSSPFAIIQLASAFFFLNDISASWFASARVWLMSLLVYSCLVFGGKCRCQTGRGFLVWIPAGTFLCGICIVSLRMCRFSPGTSASSRCPKKRKIGNYILYMCKTGPMLMALTTPRRLPGLRMVARDAQTNLLPNFKSSIWLRGKIMTSCRWLCGWRLIKKYIFSIVADEMSFI